MTGFGICSTASERALEGVSVVAGEVAAAAVRREVLDVGARRERLLPRAREHDHAHALVRAEPQRGVAQQPPHLEVDGVVLAGPVQRDRPDPVRNVDEYLLAHGAAPVIPALPVVVSAAAGTSSPANGDAVLVIPAPAGIRGARGSAHGVGRRGEACHSERSTAESMNLSRASARPLPWGERVRACLALDAGVRVKPRGGRMRCAGVAHSAQV